MTDTEIQFDRDHGMSIADIARKHGVSYQAIHQRLKRMGVENIRSAVAEVRSQSVVRRTIDGMDELAGDLEKVHLLIDACDRWLRDANDDSRYDVGPRADEVIVTYETVEISPEGKSFFKKNKDALDVLLKRVEREIGCGVERYETKHADPRELILKTLAECRQTINAMADLTDRIYNAKALQAFREAILEEIRKRDPDAAQAIAEAVQRVVYLWHGVTDGPRAVAAVEEN